MHFLLFCFFLPHHPPPSHSIPSHHHLHLRTLPFARRRWSAPVMGQGVSCTRSIEEHDFFSAVQSGDVAAVDSALRLDPSLLLRPTIYDRLAAVHIAAANGRLQVLTMLLDRSVPPDIVNRHKQTPLMLAAMHGKIACVQKLLQAGANVLMFDSLHGRTCLHYAAYYGHTDCMEVILTAAKTTQVAYSWGFARFVNIRDGYGATPLHLASRQRRGNCVHMLLDNGALVSASTGGYGQHPLHLAARGGCLDCVRELLSWGADRLQRDASGRIPYIVALKRKHRDCAALLNPASAEPLVWPAPLKFIHELNPDAKALLEGALMEANMEREKKILEGVVCSSPSPPCSDSGMADDASEDGDAELCCICFEHPCTIEVQDCGHQMCAHCMLALCCHNKANPVTLLVSAPVCPFCRRNIARLAVAKSETNEGEDTSSKLRKSRKSQNLSEGSSSFKGLTSAMGSFGRMGGRGSGRISDSSDIMDKP